MVTNRSNPRRRVMCVIATPDNQPHPLVLAATDVGAEVETVGDVYRALARLGNNSRPPIDAVLVDVGGLDSAEMEFFDLAARYQWRVPVYVFGGRSAGGVPAKINAALIRGARAVAHADRLAEVLLAIPEHADRDTRVSEPAAAPDAPLTVEDHAAIDADLERRLLAPLPADDSPEPAQPAQSAEAESDATVEPTTVAAQPGDSGGQESPNRSSAKKSSVRVPWRRYEDQPARTPPSASRNGASPAGGPAISPSPRTEPDADPPLLTPQELDALIGGQIAPAPSDPSASGEAS